MPEKKHGSRKNIPKSEQHEATVPTKEQALARSSHRAPPSPILSQPTSERVNALSTQGKKKKPK
ncbi:MAG: hypothetical protein Q8K75_05635 [Chlamydiales bacterium]|nr:hypothetical protein [Chlamydiales bacterium]